jgi:hypothetical protein
VVKKNAFFIFLMMLLSQGIASATDIPVLLRLSSSDQVDTNGCNFVEQLTLIVYNEIVAGRVKLWDSPSKEIQITGTTLQELEKNSDTQFIKQEIIYIYELWQSTHRGLTSTTLGFNFSNKNKNGEDVAYGFVEYASLKDLFLRTRISTNANGDYSATYAAYVNNKTYNYNIIQYNGKVIKDAVESNRIKNEVIGDQKFNTATFVFNDPDRFISYIVESNSTIKDEKTQNSIALINAVENYLSENQEVFYNFGGDRILSYFQKNNLKVSKLELNEIWKKDNDSIITETKSMTIYVNDSSLAPMNAKEMNKLDLSVNKINLADFIKEKHFNFVITQINAQKIARKDAFLYYKGLMSGNWRRLTEYVRNF